MATTYDLSTTAPQKFLPFGDFSIWCQIPFTTAVINDVYILPITVPAGAYVMGATLDCDDIDSNGSPAVVLAVGDATTADRFITGATVGQAGGVQGMNKVGSLGYQYTTATKIQLKVTTAAATFQAGNARVRIHLNNDVKQGGG